MKLREKKILTIEKLGPNGHGLTLIENKTIEVEDVFPGETVEAKICFISKEKTFARSEKKMEPSSWEKPASCSHAKRCGSCSWQHIEYEAQLKEKQLMLEDLFASTAIKKIHPVHASPLKAWRSKAQFPLIQDSLLGPIKMGPFQKRSHQIVDLLNCEAHSEEVNHILLSCKNSLYEAGLRCYNEETAQGLLRHLVIRFSEYEKKALLTFVINAEEIPSSLIEVINKFVASTPSLKAVLINFNTQKGNTIRGKRTELIWGENFLEEKIAGKIYRYSSESFFQTNPFIAEKICLKIKELCQGESLLDLYCGVGLYAVQLSEKMKTIDCIEFIPEAIIQAKENLQLNQAQEANCYAGDVVDFLHQYLHGKKSFDTVIVNPPRKGLEKEVIKLLPEFCRKEIFYVSCSPESLKRDLEGLSEHFECHELFPFDMFPHTHHVESLVHLKKKKHF